MVQNCVPCLLPPNLVAENVKRAHLQAIVWKQATELDPPELNPVDYGWEKNKATKSLNPVMLPKISKVLQLIKYSNGSESPCETLRCRCNSARFSCTIFCAGQEDVPFAS